MTNPQDSLTNPMEHPITPPPELIEQWRTAPEYAKNSSKAMLVSMTISRLQEIATQAARWGADQELKACCEHIKKWFVNPQYRVEELQVARRPQTSLKEQALKALDCIEADFNTIGDQCDAIRRALEILKD